MILIFNPRSAEAKHRLPNSILQVAASVYEAFPVILVDGNMEKDPLKAILDHLESGKIRYFCATVMPGPQLKQAIPFTKAVKEKFPAVTTIWGGYFASNQPDVTIRAPYVDFIVDGPGDHSFPELIRHLEQGSDFSAVSGIIFMKDGQIVKNKRGEIPNPDELEMLPYGLMEEFYPVKNYLAKTFMGKKTIAYHSSFGCPFTCAFCGIVPIYNARWKGRSAAKMAADIDYLVDTYDIDSVEFHDNNFFTSRKRVVEFAERIHHHGLNWWGEGRIDTIDKYSDEDLARMREAGCRMIFLGAETGNDAILKQMDKGGTQSADQIRKFAARMRRVDIIPEYSFVLGLPAESPEKVMENVENDIRFIREIKEINPDTEIIIYLYSPVPLEGSELDQQIKALGFDFPQKLEDWLEPAWEKFDLRKNPLTPWLTPAIINKIRDFETVLNAYHPTVSDFRIRGIKKSILKTASALRYKTGIYSYPYELKALQKFWRYRQPEIEGFYSE